MQGQSSQMEKVAIDEMNEFSGIAFAELVMYIEEVRQADEVGAPIFKLSDLGQLYSSRMEQLGVKLDNKSAHNPTKTSSFGSVS